MDTKQQSIFFAILAFVIFFTTSDLIANFAGNWTLSAVSSILSGVFVFLGTALKKKQNIEKGINTATDYICNNFNKSNVILSILDIICSIIALFTFVVAIGIIFRSILAIRLVVTINKIKTVAQAVLIGVATYLAVRWKKIKEYKMFKKIGKAIKTTALFIWANKKSICGTIFAFISGIASAIVVNAEVIATFPAIMLFGINWTPILTGVLVTCGVEIGVCGKGWEFIKEYFTRKDAEKQEKAVAEEEKKAEKEAKATAKQEAKDRKKALALIEQRKAEEEKAQAKAEEEQRIKELADKIEAEANKPTEVQ